MKYLQFLLCFSLLWTSCKEPGCTDPLAVNYSEEANKDDGSCSYEYPVKISLELNGNNTPLEKYGTFESNGISFRLENLKYYLSHFKLNNNEVADVFLYDVESESNFILTHHSSNAINSIEFGLGLTETQNNSDPTTFESAHPLSFTQNTYWYMTPPSYIFVMAETKADTLGTGEHTFAITYHLAHNDLYRMVEKNTDISLSLTDTTQIIISLELANMTNNVDLSEEIPHQSAATPTANLLMDNLSNAFTIQ